MIDRIRHLAHDAADTARAAWNADLWRMLNPLDMARGIPTLVRSRGLHPGAVFSLHAAARGDDVSLVDADGGGAARTYASLNTRACQLANAFARAGVGSGDRVLVVLPNCAEFVEVWAACAKLRAAAVPVSYRLTSPEIAYILSDASPKVIVYDQTLRAVVHGAITGAAPALFEVGGADAPAPVIVYEFALATAPSNEPPAGTRDPELILYTSGTTGRPKGAVREMKGSAILQLMGLLRLMPLRAGDVHLIAGPLYHALPGGFATVNLGLGATLVLLRKFDPEAFLAAIARYRVTTATAVPTMLRALCDLPFEISARYDLTSLRVVIAGGAALEHSLVRDFAARYGSQLLYNLYGATELGWVTIAGPGELLDKPNTIGRAVPGIEILLRADDGRALGVGEVGELYVRSELLVRGYHGNDEATQKSRFGDAFSVGDLAMRDADGCYFLSGRKVDMVVSGGVNVYPAEIEAALSTHDDVLEAAVIGVPDPQWGEALRAFVVLRNGSTQDSDALVAFLRARLAGYKIPRQWRFMGALPRNPTGKIMKRALREEA
jgi:fatty-acyl-CoA synthase